MMNRTTFGVILALCLSILPQLSFSQCSVYIPNAFSPDGSGDPDNETFRPYLPGDCTVSNYDLKIFDRWGALVFQSTNPEESWDGALNGQKLAANVYVYILRYRTGEGQEEAPPQVLTGSVALIRSR